MKFSKQLEVQGVQAAETGDLEAALTFFSQAIGRTPQRASGYNNRAQALRLKGDVLGMSVSQTAFNISNNGSNVENYFKNLIYVALLVFIILTWQSLNIEVYSLSKLFLFW